MANSINKDMPIPEDEMTKKNEEKAENLEEFAHAAASDRFSLPQRKKEARKKERPEAAAAAKAQREVVVVVESDS